MHWLQYDVNWKSWEQTSLICFLSYRDNIQFFSIKYNINIVLFADVLFSVEKVSFYSLLVVNFYHEQLLDLVKFFVFYSTNMVYYSNWCLVIKPTLHSWNKFHLVRVYNSFCILLGQFINILLSIFVFIYMMNIGM